MAPLTGYRVAVTSARRIDELGTLLRRHGATVCAAPAIALVTMPDGELRRSTEALIADPPDILIATTAIGIRGWIAAADRWGMANALFAALSATRIVSRGPKATGALRAAGLKEEWSPKSESSHELLRYLLESEHNSGVSGRRVAVQLHGDTDNQNAIPDPIAELRDAGADVIPIRAYRWRASPPGSGFDQLVTQISRHRFDAVCFTSAQAVEATLQRASELGIFDQLTDALRSDVYAMCVGPMTAMPLDRLGLPTSSPRRMRLGALARHIADELPRLATRRVRAAGHRIEIRGGYVLVDEVVKPLSSAQMATLRALAQHPGTVVPRDDLLRALPGKASKPHAVETVMSRLRAALGDKDIVVTVTRRGYRLAVDEHLSTP
jgi:uroporphyrinogen-III synthase